MLSSIYLYKKKKEPENSKKKKKKKHDKYFSSLKRCDAKTGERKNGSAHPSNRKHSGRIVAMETHTGPCLEKTPQQEVSQDVSENADRGAGTWMGGE